MNFRHACVLLLLVAILSALFIPVSGRAIRCGKVTGCANNLAQLWKMQNNYMVQYGGPERRMPEETGDEFWLKLLRPPTQMIDDTLLEIYQCPLEDTLDPGCDYRGPEWDANGLGDRDIVGADVEGNHGEGEGGNVLRKSGDVQTVSPRDPLWLEARRTTFGGNPAQPRPRPNLGEVVIFGVAGLFIFAGLICVAAGRSR